MPEHDSGPQRPAWFEQALACFQEALDLTDRDETPGFYGVILHDIADLHMAAGDVHEAAAYFRESIGYKEKADDPGDLATTMIALGDCLIGCGERTEARAVLDQTKELLAQNTGTIESARRAVRLHSLGQSYRVLGGRGQEGAYIEALTVYQAALGLIDAEADPGPYAAVLEDIGDVHRAQGRLREAHTSYAEAVGHMRRHEGEGAKRSLASLLRALGRIRRQIGEL